MKVYGELIASQLENLSSDPTGADGRAYFNTTTKLPKFYNGTAWMNFGDANATPVYSLTTDDSDGNVTVASGTSAFAPFLDVLNGHTYTVNGQLIGVSVDVESGGAIVVGSGGTFSVV